MKLNTMTLANAFGIATLVVWVICSVFIFALPELSMTITSWWLHGMDLSALGPFRLDWTNFILGGITLTVSGWIIGYIFGWALELVSKK